MPRSPRTQLAINAPPALLVRLREAAAARGTTVTRLVVDAVQAHLDAPMGPSPQPELVEELERINARLDALERRAQAPPPPEGGSKITRMSEAAAGDQGHAPLAPPPAAAESGGLEAPSDGAITGGQLARRLGLRGSGAINAWAKRHRSGDTYRGWRLLEKRRSPRGGPERWMFLPTPAAEGPADGI